MNWLQRILGIDKLQKSIDFMISEYEREENEDGYNESTTNDLLHDINDRLEGLSVQEKGYRNKFEDLNENTKKLNLMLLEFKGLVAKVRGEVNADKPSKQKKK